MVVPKSISQVAAEVRRRNLCQPAASASLRRRLLGFGVFVLAAILSTAAFAAAPIPAKSVAKISPIAPVGPSPITPDCRYLFVVEMSSAMQRSADGLYRTAHRLVASGLGGRMQEGDVFTVWTYADTVLTREFPLNAWTTDLNIALANRTYEFLAQQKFRGKSNLRPVFAELGQALAISTNLTIVLISDGTDVIVGTPFDRPINITYGKRASETRSAKMPFVTALVTEGGEFTRWSVRAGLEDIGLPLPVKPVAPVPVPVVAQAPVVVTPPPAPVPVPPVVAPVKPPAPTNPLPVVVVAKAPEPVTPKPAPAPPVVAPPPPKPAEPPPVVVVPKKPEPVAPPAVAEKKPAVTPTPPTPAPKQEAKVAQPPPPKPVVVAPTPPAPVAQPAVKPMKVELVLEPPPPIIPPALRQPKSFIDASNALAKVELLRPPSSTSAPPAKPLEARVIEPKPTAPKATNPVVVVAKPAPAPAPLPVTNAPVAKPATNAPVAVAAPAKTIPIVVPPAKQTVAKTNEQKTTATATNSPPRTNAATKAVAGKSKPEAPAVKATAAKPTETEKPAAQLAVASPRARDGGWLYLATAVALLALAGVIIGRLLRPRPQPSAISQSLDEPPK